MRRITVLVLVLALMVGLTAPAVEAGGRTAINVVLGLASFAVFNQIVGPFVYPRLVHAPYGGVVVAGPPVYPVYPVYVTRPVYYGEVYVLAPAVIQAPSPYPTVIQYPHGRYELRGDGVRAPYQWVWIPNPPPPPPVGPPPPAPPQ